MLSNAFFPGKILRFEVIHPSRNVRRGNRQITRQTLIAIARKKQELGMVTAYITYRLKKVKGSRQRTDPNDHVASLEIAQKVGMKIDNLDTVA